MLDPRIEDRGSSLAARRPSTSLSSGPGSHRRGPISIFGSSAVHHGSEHLRAPRILDPRVAQLGLEDIGFSLRGSRIERRR
eukprot:2342283-Pyramimonas_sp.AAC.1